MQDGYENILKLADNFATFSQRLKFAHFRPVTLVKSNPKAWWQYAYKAISDQTKNERYGRWQQILVPETSSNLLMKYIVTD